MAPKLRTMAGVEGHPLVEKMVRTFPLNKSVRIIQQPDRGI